MKIMTFSERGDGMGIAQRIANDGHLVDVFRADAPTSTPDTVTAALVFVPSWRPSAQAADLVFIDGNAPDGSAEFLRAATRLVFGGNGASTHIAPIPEGAPTQSLIGFWNGICFTQPFYHMISLHKQLNDDFGPDVPAIASVMWEKDHHITAFDDALSDYADILKYSDYRGMVEFEMYHLNQWELSAIHEHTNMMALTTILELTNETPLQFLLGIAAGTQTHIKPASDVGVAYRLTTSPWPWGWGKHFGADAFNVDPGAEKHIWWADTDLNEAYYSTGLTGQLGFATARGKWGHRQRDRIREPMRRLRRVIDGIGYSQLYYRTDAPEALRDRLLEIQHA